MCSKNETNNVSRLSFITFILSLVLFCLPSGNSFAWNGNYLMVDGNGDYAEFLPEGPLDVAYDNSKSFTVEFWVQATDYGVIISDDAYDIIYNYDNETFFTDVIEFTLYLNGFYVVFKRPVNLTNGWHHVVCLFNNLTNLAAIGIDGSLAWSDSIVDDDGLWNGDWPFLIGSLTESYGFFTGMIDEVRLTDGVRYTGTTYSVPTVPFSTDGNTLALWHFDDSPDSTTFIDSSGNSNNLTARGDAVATTAGSGGHETSLYLRSDRRLMESAGDPVRKVIVYVNPESSSVQEWQTTLCGEITGNFAYHLDVTNSETPAVLKIQFIVEHDGEETCVAVKYINIGSIPEGVYHTYSGLLDGLDLVTRDGDTLIFRVIPFRDNHRRADSRFGFPREDSLPRTTSML